MIDVLSHDVVETHQIADAISRLVRPRDVIVLAGEMGAGKTAFTVGFAQAMGVSADDYVSSPTFNLVQSYTSGRLPIQHADLYRLSSRAEVEDLGLRELADMGSVVIVEWGDVASEVLGDALTISLENHEDDEESRYINISVEGHSWDSRWQQLVTALRSWSIDR